MKKTIILILITTLLLVGCSNTTNGNDEPEFVYGSAIMIYREFVDILPHVRYAVVAQYVETTLFGLVGVRKEFTVSEKILGVEVDTIYVYIERMDVDMVDAPVPGFRTTDIHFEPGVDYLLLLRLSNLMFSSLHEDGFLLIADGMTINLENPAESTIYNQLLGEQPNGLDFNVASRGQIISALLAVANQDREVVQVPESVEEIIADAPYVLVVEIGENDLRHRDTWVLADLYYVTIIESLKGDPVRGRDFWMTLPAYAVSTGERHIVATYRVSYNVEHIPRYRLTTENSLFGIEQREQIEEILGIR